MVRSLLPKVSHQFLYKRFPEMNTLKNKNKWQYLIILLVATLLVACESEKYLPTTVRSEPEVSISQITEPTADLSSSISDFSLLSQYQFKNLPHLYITVDPVIPPFYSKILSIRPEIIGNDLSNRKTNLVTDDYEFLERDPNLTWSSNYDKAILIAKGLYYVLEEQFATIEKSGVQKKAQMENYLLQLFPSLTQIELDAINKTVCEEVKAAAVAAGLTSTTTTKTVVTNDEKVADTTTTIIETKEVAVKSDVLLQDTIPPVVVDLPQT